MRSMCYIPPRRLLFSGGGIRVIGYLGALHVLEEKHMLHQVREFCGVSAGALVSLMLALNYSLKVIERFCFEFDFSQIGGFEIDSVLDSIEEFGINSGDSIKSLIRKILFHKGFGPDTTFAELAASGKTKQLRVWASDIQYLKLLEFSAEKTPEVCIQLALYASMTLPMYFIPVHHPVTKTLLLDGGVLDNYPISSFTEEEVEQTLGFTFEHSKLPVDVNDFSSFLSVILGGYYMPSYQKMIEKHKCRTIILPCQEVPSIHFEATKEEKQRLMAIGRQATETFFKKCMVQTYRTRRNSVG